MYALDSSRAIDWTYAGVPGGIPERTTIYTTLSSGATAAQIVAAITACPAGQVVFLSAGTYNLGASYIAINAQKQKTLRGAGAGQTTILSSASAPIYFGGAAMAGTTAYSLYVALAKDATSLTIASAPPSTCEAGGLLRVSSVADNEIMWYTSTGNVHFHIARVTEVTDNGDGTYSIDFTPPNPHPFAMAQSPVVRFKSNATTTSLCGVESMTIQGSGASNVRMYEADRCWLKDCEVTYGGNTDTGMINIQRSTQCELRRNYVHDVASWPNQQDGYGIYACWESNNTLIEDNIIRHTATCFQASSSANVWGYNYLIDMYRDYPDVRSTYAALGLCHWAYGAMSLYEGNVATAAEQDQSHGNTTHQVFFRNHLHGISYNPGPLFLETSRHWVFWLGACCFYHTAIGNILGDSSWAPDTYEVTGSVPLDNSTSGIYKCEYPLASHVNYSYVPSYVGYSGTFPDPDGYLISDQFLRHANYDYYNESIVYIDGEDTALPDSLYHASKPSWFGSMVWPPIGPDVSGYVEDIPAKWRWERYVISDDLSDLFTADVGEITGFVNEETVFLTVSEDEVAKLYVEIPKKRAVVGTSVVYNVHAEPWHDFVGDITLDVTGLPTNATDAYGQNPIAYNGNTTVTVTTTAVSAGTYSMYITGTSEGGDVASVRVVLEITESADADIKVPFRRIRAKQGDNAVFTIQADALSGYTDNVDLSVSGVPTGATSEFGATPIAYNGSTTLTVDTGTAAVGEHELIITGEGPA